MNVLTIVWKALKRTKLYYTPTLLRIVSTYVRVVYYLDRTSFMSLRNEALKADV